MISVLFLGFILLLFLWNLFFAHTWNKKVVVSFAFLQQFVYAGEQAQMTECVENGKKLPLPVLEVAFHIDKGLSFLDCENTNVSDYTYKRDIFALLGKQRITRKLTLHCMKRGYYSIKEADLTTFTLLHERRYSAAYPAQAEIYVYARRTDVSDILSACERLMGNVQCAKRLFEDPFAFASIREYTITDPMKAINWKASAKTGALMVNTWESTLTEKVMIYLDMEDRGILKQESLIEESVSIAASLTQRMTGRGMEVGICVNAADRNPADARKEEAGSSAGHIFIPPAGGRRQLALIERMLAKCRADAQVQPFGVLLQEMTETSEIDDAVMIFISKNAAENMTAIDTYVGKERHAVWVIPYCKSGGCEIAGKENIHLVKREVEQI